MERERTQQGQYAEKATEEVILEIFALTSDPVLTAKEVAKELDVSGETARRKLNELHERGEMERKDVGSRAVVWWRAE